MMNDKWLEFAIRIQSIAQAGLQYGKDRYDIERYEELRKISAEMMAEKTDIPVNKIYNLFCGETGYQTPKIDTRAAVFSDGAMLISRSRPTPKRRCARRRDVLFARKDLSPCRTGAGTMR